MNINRAEIKETYKDTLRSLESAGLLKQSSVGKVDTEHNRKDRRGRLADWWKWKTPLRRWTRRLQYREVRLVTVLERAYEYGELGEMELEAFGLLCERVAGQKVWEQYRATDPYEVMVADLNIVPVVPLDYIKMTFSVGEEKNEIRAKE